MPNHDFTSKLLEMEDIIVSNVSSSSSGLHISFSLKRKPHICPHCSFVTEQIHDYRTSVIKDIPVMGKQTFLHYRKRRYHYPCCKKHFYESFRFLPKYCRITTRLAFYAIHLQKNRYSVSSSAKLLGISASSVFRRLKDIRYPRPRFLPKVLSIDEFKGNSGGQKFHAIFTDAHNHQLFDMLPGHWKM